MSGRFLGTAIVIVIGLSFAGCKSKEERDADAAKTKAESDKLQGKWKLVSRQTDEDEEDPIEPSFYYQIDGDMFKQVMKVPGGQEEVLEYQKITLSPDKDAKQIDLTLTDEKGSPIKMQSVKKGITGKKKKSSTTFKDVGIYKLEGDKLTICMSWDEKKRPTDFAAPRGTGRYMITLERIKDGSEAAKSTEKSTEKKIEDKKTTEKSTEKKIEDKKTTEKSTGKKIEDKKPE